MSDKLDLILEKLNIMEQSTNERFDKIEQKLNQMHDAINVLDSDVKEIKEKQACLETQMDDVSTTTAFVTKDVYMLKNRAK